MKGKIAQADDADEWYDDLHRCSYRDKKAMYPMSLASICTQSVHLLKWSRSIGRVVDEAHKFRRSSSPSRGTRRSSEQWVRLNRSPDNQDKKVKLV